MRLSLVLPFVPAVAFAQTATLADYIMTFGSFVNVFVVPLLLGLAFAFFIWNAVRYFIIGGASSESQGKAKALALWGVLAFVFILSIWGLTNVIVSSFGIGQNRVLCPDYYPNCDKGRTQQRINDMIGPPSGPDPVLLSPDPALDPGAPH